MKELEHFEKWARRANAEHAANDIDEDNIPDIEMETRIYEAEAIAQRAAKTGGADGLAIVAAVYVHRNSPLPPNRIAEETATFPDLDPLERRILAATINASPAVVAALSAAWRSARADEASTPRGANARLFF
jgi:hypothetical protein